MYINFQCIEKFENAWGRKTNPHTPTQINIIVQAVQPYDAEQIMINLKQCIEKFGTFDLDFSMQEKGETQC
jgi:hypothetical protein